MAKKTILQIFNGVLHNAGLAEVSALTSLDPLQTAIWDKIQESVIEIAGLYKTKWGPLMGTATMIMLTATNTLAVATDLLEEVVDSFRVPDDDNILVFLTEQEWDEKYPKGIQTTDTGWPKDIKRSLAGNVYELSHYPTATQNGKKIYYRYKKMPTLFVASVSTGTCWIPEQYDDLVLVNLATYKTMVYMGMPKEAADYWVRVMGDGRQNKGYLSQMKSIYANSGNALKVRVTYPF